MALLKKLNLDKTSLVITAGSANAAAQTDDSSMAAAAGAEARVMVIGCEDLVTVRAGESRRVAEASIAASGEGRIAVTTSNIAEANTGDATDTIASRGVSGISAKARESSVATGGVDRATVAEARVARRERRSTIATLNRGAA